MLEGFRILELGQVIAGTISGLILADLGAEVIKVESPQGDLGRNPTIADVGGMSAIFLSFNRNKKSVVINLKTEEGLQVFYDLVRRSDAVLDNFRPGVLERLKVDYAHLREVNPQIISLSVSGFGSWGPLKDLPSFDLVHQAISGHMSITGEPGRPPSRAGVPLADITTAMYAAHAALAALLSRERTGQGRRLEVAMFDAQLAVLGYIAAMFLVCGHIAEPPGSAHEYMVPYQAFPARDGYLVVSPREDRFWVRMCEVMGCEELAHDARFATNDRRLQNRAELIPLLEARFREKTVGEWLDLLVPAGVPAAPVNRLDAALTHPQVEARELIAEFDYPGYGRVRTVGNPIKEPETPPSPPEPPPTPGQHTEEILRKMLGYGDEKVGELREKGAVA
ncbi:MAG: CaiB/BaiF CoA transferase family protein [Nitrospinota bacterium]